MDLIRSDRSAIVNHLGYHKTWSLSSRTTRISKNPWFYFEHRNQVSNWRWKQSKSKFWKESRNQTNETLDPMRQIHRFDEWRWVFIEFSLMIRSNYACSSWSNQFEWRRCSLWIHWRIWCRSMSTLSTWLFTHSQRPNEGPLFRFPVTVIKPIDVVENGHMITFDQLKFRPGHIERRFIAVPDLATSCSTKIR